MNIGPGFIPFYSLLFHFPFLFYFILFLFLLFLILNLDKEVWCDVMYDKEMTPVTYVTVICHTIMWYKESYRKFY